MSESVRIAVRNSDEPHVLSPFRAGTDAAKVLSAPRKLGHGFLKDPER